MPNDQNTNERRALATPREREIISGEADVTDQYRYQTVSRVRRRLKNQLSDDLEAFADHGDLLTDFCAIATDYCD